MTNIRSYLKFLSRNKLYTFVTVFGFAVSLMFVFLLGIYIRQELSVDKFHEKKDRIYLLTRDNFVGNFSRVSAFSNPVAEVIKDKCPEVESYVRIVSRPVSIDMSNGEKIKAEGLFADSTFFNVFSFPLIEGDPSRVIESKQDVVLSKSFSLKLFPGENPVGKTIKIGDDELVVTGVMKDIPQNTQLQKSDLVLNYRMIENNWGGKILHDWGNSSFGMYFLAKPGTNLPAKAPMLLEEFKENYWIYQHKHAHDLSFVKLEDVYFGNIGSYFTQLRNNSKTTVSIYLVITLLILIVAILNYVNLSITQAVKRGKESAIKKLLGSSRSALFIQFISEATLMTALSLLIAIFLAFIAEPFFNDVLTTQLNLSHQFTPGVILVLLLSILVIGIISGLFPALTVSKFQPIEVVKGLYQRKVKTVYTKVLITFQYTVAIVLLICSAFIVLQIRYMKNFDLGFAKDNILILDNVLNPEQLPGFRDKLMTISGVEKVSFAAGTPIDGGNNNSFDYHGTPMSFQVFEADTAFFDIFGITINPTGVIPSDTTILLNQIGYNLLQPDSITHVVNYGGNWQEAVEGVISDIHFRSLHVQPGPLKIYKMKEKSWPWSIVVKLEKGSDIFRTADLIKSTYSDYNGGQIFDIEFADDTVQSWYEKEEKTMKIIMAFTVLTILILMMGVFSMALYFVQQKEKEIAIRKVQGSTEMQIMSMLNMDFVKFILLAFIISVPIAYYFSSQFLQDFAYRISLSWWVFILSGLFTIIISIIFITIQSWKTATENPIEALKNE